MDSVNKIEHGIAIQLVPMNQWHRHNNITMTRLNKGRIQIWFLFVLTGYINRFIILLIHRLDADYHGHFALCIMSFVHLSHCYLYINLFSGVGIGTTQANGYEVSYQPEHYSSAEKK